MRPRFALGALLVFALVFVLAACSPGSAASSTLAPTVSDAWARPAPAGGQSAAYFTLSNQTGSGDTLLSAGSPVAEMAGVHRTSVDANGVAVMNPVDRLELPSGSTLEFKPGGNHLMLMGLTKDLTAGATIELDLVFEHAGTVVVQAAIR